MLGTHHLNEVFFDELRVTDADVLGPVDGGWSIVADVMSFERVGIARYARCERLLAAGPLEDVISMKTIERIECEAADNDRFRDLLGGVWYFRASDELKARLDALIGDNRW